MGDGDVTPGRPSRSVSRERRGAAAPISLVYLPTKGRAVGCDRDATWFEEQARTGGYPDGIEASLILARILRQRQDAHVPWHEVLQEGKAAGLSTLEVLAGLTRLETAGRVKLSADASMLEVRPLAGI